MNGSMVYWSLNIILLGHGGGYSRTRNTSGSNTYRENADSILLLDRCNRFSTLLYWISWQPKAETYNDPLVFLFAPSWCLSTCWLSFLSVCFNRSMVWISLLIVAHTHRHTDVHTHTHTHTHKHRANPTHFT